RRSHPRRGRSSQDSPLRNAGLRRRGRNPDRALWPWPVVAETFPETRSRRTGALRKNSLWRKRAPAPPCPSAPVRGFLPSAWSVSPVVGSALAWRQITTHGSGIANGKSFEWELIRVGLGGFLRYVWLLNVSHVLDCRRGVR